MQINDAIGDMTNKDIYRKTSKGIYRKKGQSDIYG